MDSISRCFYLNLEHETAFLINHQDVQSFSVTKSGVGTVATLTQLGKHVEFSGQSHFV